MKTNRGNVLLGFIASTILVAICIGGVVFLFNYFKGARQDILSKDVKIETLVQGTGGGAKQGDTVIVNYIGTLPDSTPFDDTYKKGVPLKVIIGERRVIPGWEKGLLGIKKGEKRLLTIPPALAYGPRGYPDPSGSGFIIPPDSYIIFTVEAIDLSSRGYLQ